MILTLLAGIVSAHAPIGVGSNEEIANATLFPDPEKSYVLYTELHEGGEAQYYRFPLRNGQRLYGSLQVPGPGSMVPDLVIIGPGIVPSGDLPSFVEVPAGSSAMVIPGDHPGTPSYEPFTPQPVYEVARFNVTVPKDGDYYLAVYGPEGCKYSLAPGYIEEFTASEWLLIPWSVVSIHLWEGQSPAYIFAPLAVVVIIGGLALFMLYQKGRGSMPDLAGWLILVAGLLYLGGAGMTGLQVVHAVQRTGWDSGVLLTLAFIAGPLFLGAYAILLGVRSPGAAPSLRRGVAMVVIGLLGLLLWAGLLVGPIFAIVGGVVTLAQRAKR
ncbi:MAG: hypothetical protein ABFC89_05280 [Methanospirillum sp.]